jgi:hypothetical protein
MLFRTPAFEPGHAGFTSNAELMAVMRGLVRDGGLGGTGVRLVGLGSSQAGAPLEALVFARASDLAPEALRRSGRPTVLLVGGQHGDEPAGTEALIVVMQELASGRLSPLLDRINVVVLPRANPDGANAGSRATASGIDANRDHLLLRTPEAQAMALLAREFHPAVVVDLHEYTVAGRFLEKFGNVQRFDALLQYAMTPNLPAFLTPGVGEWFRQPLVARLKAEGLSSEWYYTTSTDLADKKVAMGGIQPDTGRNVNGLRNTVSFLIETRGVGIGRLHLGRRVQTQIVATEEPAAQRRRTRSRPREAACVRRAGRELSGLPGRGGARRRRDLERVRADDDRPADRRRQVGHGDLGLGARAAPGQAAARVPAATGCRATRPTRFAACARWA